MPSPWAKLGCSEALYGYLRSMHVDYGKTPIGQYRQHKKSAAQRDIPFDLTLSEWWDIWDKSGHYAQRGTHRGQYVMARKYDRGAYTTGNVAIVTCYENVIQRMIVMRARRGSARKLTGGGFSRVHPPEVPFKTLERVVRDNA